MKRKVLNVNLIRRRPGKSSNQYRACLWRSEIMRAFFHMHCQRQQRCLEGLGVFALHPNLYLMQQLATRLGVNHQKLLPLLDELQAKVSCILPKATIWSLEENKNKGNLVCWFLSHTSLRLNLDKPALVLRKYKTHHPNFPGWLGDWGDAGV